MNNIYTKTLLVFLMMSLAAGSLFAQVNIGLTEAPADAALLQIRDKDVIEANNVSVEKGGMLLPRVTLQKLTLLEPLTITNNVQKPLHVGTLVYNSTINLDEELYNGIYVWDGERWIFLVAEANDLGIKIKNPIDKVLKTYPSGHTPQNINDFTQNIAFDWLPTDARMTLASSVVINGGVSISGTLPSGIIGGTYTHPIQLASMTAAEIDDSPFLEKVSTIDIFVNAGGAIKLEKVLVRQVHYNLLVTNLANELELGKRYTAKIKTNVNWQVSVIQNAGAVNIENYTGGTNVVVGSDFSFSLVDNDFWEGQDVIFEFVSINSDGTVNNQIAPVQYSFKTIKEYPNAYFVTPGEEIEISARKPYNVWMDEFGETLSGAVSAKLVWQDEQSLISNITVDDQGRNSVIKVKTAAGKVGNAVVAVMIGGNTDADIKWSWHLWITDYNPNTIVTEDPNYKSPYQTGGAVVEGGRIDGYYNGSYKTIFMDRYLGAHDTAMDADQSSGFAYQWGRKDPLQRYGKPIGPSSAPYFPKYDIANQQIIFPISNAVFDKGTELSTEIPARALKLSIVKPNMLFVANQSTFNETDWYSSVPGIKDNNLWGNHSVKGVYDPCPLGWKVLAYDQDKYGMLHPLYGLLADAPFPTYTGFDFTAQGGGIWPSRTYISLAGALEGAGSYLRFWQGIIVGPKALYLNAYSSTNPLLHRQFYLFNGGRGFGLQVRCMKDPSHQ